MIRNLIKRAFITRDKLQPSQIIPIAFKTQYKFCTNKTILNNEQSPSNQTNINNSTIKQSDGLNIRRKLKQLKRTEQQQIYNLTPRIQSLCEKKLLHIQNHPLCILKNRITKSLGESFKVYDNMDPIVSVYQNFDILNFPIDHCTRSPSDTYYINNSTVLRTHTSAHQVQNISKPDGTQFVVFGDVYRRDEIDKYHYPAFHQMQAVKIMGSREEFTDDQIVEDLKNTVEKIIHDLFGKVEMRWIDAYFPFTEPSLEVEIFYQGKWIQMLGCGVIHKFVMEKSGRQNQVGWAAGLGLQRFAMKLFKIPDVRLFWSEDKRFIDQFKPGEIVEFKQFSKYPVCSKDFSMWITNPDLYNPNDLSSIIRQIGGDLVESVQQIDSYVNPKTNQLSKAYRINFRSLQRTLLNDQITKIQFQIRDEIQKSLKHVSLR